MTLEENLNQKSRVGRQETAEASGSGSSSSETEAVEAEAAEGGDDDTATEKATTPLNGLSTAVKINQNVTL